MKVIPVSQMDQYACSFMTLWCTQCFKYACQGIASTLAMVMHTERERERERESVCVCVF